MRQLITLILILIATPGWAAQTGFQTNYSGWKSLSQNKKVGYVMGVIDYYFLLFVDDVNNYNKRAAIDGIEDCLDELKITDHMLAEAVTKHYENNLDHWENGPAMVLHGVVRSICLKFINKQRIQLGLSPPWKKWKGY